MNTNYILAGAGIGAALGAAISWGALKLSGRPVPVEAEETDREDFEDEEAEGEQEGEFKLAENETVSLSDVAAARLLSRTGWKREDLLYFPEDEVFGAIEKGEDAPNMLSYVGNDELLAVVKKDQELIERLEANQGGHRWYASGKDNTIYRVTVNALEDFATMSLRLLDMGMEG